jgi:hypothetical protein
MLQISEYLCYKIIVVSNVNNKIAPQISEDLCLTIIAVSQVYFEKVLRQNGNHMERTAGF